MEASSHRSFLSRPKDQTITSTALLFFVVGCVLFFGISSAHAAIVQVEVKSAVSNGAGSMITSFNTPTTQGELVTVAVVTGLGGNIPTARLPRAVEQPFVRRDSQRSDRCFRPF